MDSGLLLIDKPKGFTSFDVAGKLRKHLGTKRVGHTGTLDPIATGVLPVLFGKACRLSDFAMVADKRYTAAIKLGITTDSYDITGTVISTHSVNIIPEEVKAVMRAFRGRQLQLPPMFSAVKINGQRLYDLARQGKSVERVPREIDIKEIEVISIDGDEIIIDVLCSKGTYIRSLAFDIGERLGCGGTITALRRTMTAGIDISECADLDSVCCEVNQYIIRADRLVSHLPSVNLDAEQAKLFLNGVRLDIARVDISAVKQGDYRVYGGDEFLGIAEARIAENELRGKVVFS